MKLPDYFLADLPPQATLTAGVIAEACQTLKRNRERYLAGRSTEGLMNALADVARDWLSPTSPFRKRALEHGPAATGFSSETLAAGLDAFFGGFTLETLRALVVQDLGHLQRLERLSATDADQRLDRAALVRGPELLVHITGGVLPNPVFLSIVLGFLTRSAQFVKCASGTSFLPRLFAHSIYESEPKLGACLEIAEWKGGTAPLEEALFAEADCVTAMGSDESIARIRDRLPGRTRFLGYGQRVSFGYIAQEVLSGLNPRKLAARAARDVIAWNQLGCLSPHLFYVEAGGGISPGQFAELLATEMAAGEQAQPRGPISPEESAAIAARRSFYEIRSLHSSDTRLWCSPNSTAWTVIYEHEPTFQLSCLNRLVYVKAVAGVEQALQGADAVRGKVSTVGLAATENRAQSLATQWAQWGVARICSVGQMQHPPLTWRHDGRPSLGDLVTWTDWETG